MFENLKKIQQIKNLLNSEKIEVEKNGLKVIINGKMEIEEIKLNPDLDFKTQEKILKDCLNEAIKKLQISLAQKMANNF
jgi:DNA-binding protein YbaB